MRWGWLACLWIGCLAGIGCDREDTPPAASSPTEPSQPPASPWRYADAMAKALPNTPFRIVVELSRGGQGLAWVVAATVDEGVPQLTLWTFEQQDEDVAPHGTPQPLTRARPGDPPRPAHDEFRRNLAAPGAVVRRPVGLPAADAKALATTLTEHARVANDTDQAAAQRVAATGQLVQGLDDALVFERDELAEIVGLLADPSLQIGEATSQSPRRATVPLTVGDSVRTAQVWAKGEGWTLVGLEPAE